jgi:hypothetical protein
VHSADDELDAEDEWDDVEYAPLSDIGSGLPHKKTASFVAKLVQDCGVTSESQQENMVTAKFIDEENVTKQFWVHETHASNWKVNATYVLHRAQLMGDVAHGTAFGMLAESPASYMWTPKD